MYCDPQSGDVVQPRGLLLSLSVFLPRLGHAGGGGSLLPPSFSYVTGPVSALGRCAALPRTCIGRCASPDYRAVAALAFVLATGGFVLGQVAAHRGDPAADRRGATDIPPYYQAGSGRQHLCTASWARRIGSSSICPSIAARILGRQRRDLADTTTLHMGLGPRPSSPKPGLIF